LTNRTCSGSSKTVAADIIDEALVRLGGIRDGGPAEPSTPKEATFDAVAVSISVREPA
jgi:hypothetical protein